MPGVVLVHGGMHAGWCWDRVVPLLSYPAVAVDLPGRPDGKPADGTLTLADYADSIVEQADAAGFDEVVLVGHSLAGLSIPLAADRLGARIKHLVFVSAFVPRAGSRGTSMLPAPLRQAVEFQLRRMASTPGAAISLPPSIVRRYFCHQLSDEDSWVVQARCCPEPAGPISETLPAGLMAYPSTYLGFRDDRAIPPRLQRKFADAGGAQLITIDGGHDAMFNNAAGVARVLNWIAREVS